MGESARKVDVAIVGGGMAGASLALMLSHFCPQLRVALLEQRALPDAAASIQLPSFDTRATAIAAGSLQLFQELGLWPALQAYSASIERIHVSDRGHAFGASLSSREGQGVNFEGILGAVIENAALGPILHSALARTSTQLLAPAQVTDINMTSAGANLLWRAGENSLDQSLSCGLVVAADGVNSPLCRQLGIEISSVKYQQRALVTTVGLQKPHNGVAYERFTRLGPMALLPLPDREGHHRAALVWACEEAEAERVSAMSEPERLEKLQQIFGWRAGRFIKVGAVQGYPLSLSIAQEQWRRNVVLMGNCAHFLHPVAGQGFNLTLRDCYGLAQALSTVSPDALPGRLDFLREYGEMRRLDQQLTIGFSDRIPMLFSSSGWLQQGIRQLGMLGLTMVPPLRREFVGQAAGFGL
ncbi:2-octaprenyl-3-methyl-6-methoxy-1,4-benzoquinol hydroxylase [Microbulbifer sp. A4B17]|uniref:FAD-dependent monooxygenase n=1 Tax=Microbulbifer sp. A4B17 TaxID=359370 RepID=UPI000D52B720|nr:FAD-dependent monooxygenase [Microbulbifer sp. A4B17]AWF82962.1 2-octaprenyl-3-methyl-6-methoxy-1,4-benzoquinol hydroxylase [Microbulbifer sp. A4B17]